MPHDSAPPPPLPLTDPGLHGPDHRRPLLLLVDDSRSNLAVLNSLLGSEYHTRVAVEGAGALALARAEPLPDLILLDVMMPEMDGFEVCRRLKSDPVTAGIPVIFLTALTSVEDEERGFALGAVDYITKPISPPIVAARVRNHLALKQAHDLLNDRHAFLEQTVARRIEEVSRAKDATILSMASLAVTRQAGTVQRLKRLQQLTHHLGQAVRNAGLLGRDETHRLDSDYLELLRKSVPLHDIGLIGIPDRINQAPPPRSPEDEAIWRTHPVLGRDAIAHAESLIAAPASFLSLARELAYHHHECWDGTGFPLGLAATAIPLSARLLAVADTYERAFHADGDARQADRGTRSARALAALEAARGSALDPRMVDTLTAAAEQFTHFADATPAQPEGPVAVDDIFAP